MPALSADPTGELVPLERRVLTLWRVRATLAWGTLTVAITAVATLAVGWLAAVATASAAVVLGATVIPWWTALVWRAWQFRLGGHALQLRHGVLTRHESTIPFHRVQHIDLEAGPLERRFGLTSLVLRTASASSDATVPGIDAGEAAALRERILARIGEGDAL